MRNFAFFFNCSTLSKNLKKRYILKRSFNQHLMILNNFKNPLEELYHSVSSVQSYQTDISQ